MKTSILSLLLITTILSGCTVGKSLLKPVDVPVSINERIVLTNNDKIYAMAGNDLANQPHEQILTPFPESPVDSVRKSLILRDLESNDIIYANYLALVEVSPSGFLGANLKCKVSLITVDRRRIIASAECDEFCGNGINAILKELGVPEPRFFK